MADHRVTDLSYGHLGEASYDIDEKQWAFSIDSSQQQIFQQLVPSTEIHPPSAPDTLKTNEDLNSTRAQMKWLVRSHPETFPASIIASALTRTSSAIQPSYSPSYGRSLAVGGAVDVGHLPGHRTVPVIAMPCGEAGHILRLIKPQVETRGWGAHSSAKLSLLDAASGDLGHWVGTGGAIDQITFADEQSASSTLLAVRQASTVTIFRPMYHRQPVMAAIPSAYAKQYPPSRLSTNPVAVLATERCGSGRHVDLSFNPFYTLQFAVIGDSGRWSIWDIEGRLRKRSTLELVPGKSGEIYDGFVPNPREKRNDSVDDWHRVLWVTNVNTIVVCNRSHIAVFDIQMASPVRLPSPRSLSTNTNDWILDIKRSPSNASHLFALTTSRIFWLEVITPGGDIKDDSNAGLRVILSYCHFRDASDETMSLTILEDHNVSVLISSAQNVVVNHYTFSTRRTGIPASSQGSFQLSMFLESQDQRPETLQTLFFLAAPLTPNPSRVRGPELQLLERNVKFYQIFSLTSTLALTSALCAINTGSPLGHSSSGLEITAPTARISRRARNIDSTQLVADSFIAPDEPPDKQEVEYTPLGTPLSGYRPGRRPKVREELEPRINWRNLFRQVFVHDDPHNYAKIGGETPFETMSEVLDDVSAHVEQQADEDMLPMTSLLELSQLSEFSGDLQQSAPALRDFVESLQADQDPNGYSDLILSNLAFCSDVDFSTTESSSFPDLLKVYDQVGEFWLASLPRKVPNLTRLSRFKITRKVAVELCLSSIAVSLRKKSSQISETPSQIRDGAGLPSNRELDASSPFASLDATTNSSPNPRFGLPTPSRTPSIYSHVSTSSAEPAEDPSISRLRQYALSIAPQTGLSKSAILSQWPSSPRVDPAQYSWRSMADDDVEEDDSRKGREEARRQKRRDKFLRQDGTGTSKAASQPTSMSFGSQPELGQPAVSSQVVDNIPMSQPDRGVFGGRSARVGKKKQTKRRAAGF